MCGTDVKAFMTQGVPTVTLEVPVGDVIRRVTAAPDGLVAVCDRGRLVGTLTEQDVVTAPPPARAQKDLKVADILSADLIYCFEDTDIEEAERLMRQSGLDRVVVLDRLGRAVGTLSLASLARRRAC
jgi:CBS domain-containing protein